jgi:hypothetical protein
MNEWGGAKVALALVLRDGYDGSYNPLFQTLELMARLRRALLNRNESRFAQGNRMSPTPSRLVAAVASLALASCSSIGTINGTRLDAGATPDRGYPCEDFEWLCFVATAAIVGGVILALQKEKPLPPGTTGAPVITPTSPSP